MSEISETKIKSMTREEIIEFCEMKAELEPENEDIYEVIIKELEPTDVLDKIRAEIAKYGSIWVEYKITGRSDKDIEQLVSDVLKQAKEQVLDVIDKYKAESESEE